MTSVPPGVLFCIQCSQMPGGAAVARGGDPQTSWDAARSVTPVLRKRQAEVLDLFKMCGPMHDELLIREAALAGVKQSDSGLRTRRSELVGKGLVRDSGRKVKTLSKRKSVVWEIV